MQMQKWLALAALLLSAGPLAAQTAPTHRFDGGTFSIDLPAYIPGLELLHQDVIAGQRLQWYGGGHVDGSVVMVMRGQPAAFSTDTAGMRANLMQVMHDTALITRYLHALSDTAHPEHEEIVRVMRDTTLTGRRWFLRQFRGTGVALNPSGWITLSGDPREIVTDERITLRSAVTLRLGEDLPPLYGTVDVLIQRRGESIVWMVAHAAKQRTPAFDAATERILASFRVNSPP